MSLTLDLLPEEEQHIQRRARAEGVPTTDYVRRLIVRDLESEREEQRRKNAGAVALLRRWRETAASLSEDERRAGDLEWTKSMRELDESREFNRKLFPEFADIPQK